MLQQTQVGTVIPYYNRFVKEFPDLRALAEAALADILKAWEGLGYYARARNLQRAARVLVNEQGGVLPNTHEALLKIPGIGPYTAAAVASIAYNENYPVVDGNVIRVLARVMKILTPPSQKTAKSGIVNAATELLPAGQAGDFNQAMMELGATVCTPKKPNCSECPVASFCQAHQTMRDPSVLPAKIPPRKRPHYDIAVGIVWNDDRLLMVRRPTSGMLGGLWEFPGGKQEKNESLERCLEREIQDEMQVEVDVLAHFRTVPHAYTHFKITLHAFQCRYLAGQPSPKTAADWDWLEPEQVTALALPKSNKKILEALMENRR